MTCVSDCAQQDQADLQLLHNRLQAGRGISRPGKARTAAVNTGKRVQYCAVWTEHTSVVQGSQQRAIRQHLWSPPIGQRQCVLLVNRISTKSH